jgi:thioredoxin-like negative regulator of GroEL
MKEVILKNLRQELDNDKDKVLIGVVLYTQDCAACNKFTTFIETIESSQQDFKFWKVDIEDEIPLFAPNVLPYIAVFWQGIRVYEGMGDPGEEAFIKSLDWWVNSWKKAIGQSAPDKDLAT